MTLDKDQAMAGMTARQKITAGIFLLVLVVVIWQVIGLFRGGNSASTPVSANKADNIAMKASMPTNNMASPKEATPQPAELPQPAMSPREMALAQLQKETQEKYLAALNELQMLKISREIAETNRAIATAKLATVTAEKNIIVLLTGQAMTSGAYGKNIEGNNQQQNTPPVTQGEYTVISVSQAQYRWSAVMGYQGNLYNVNVGDVLPADGSTVVSISRSGVVLSKDGVNKKISLVPII